MTPKVRSLNSPEADGGHDPISRCNLAEVSPTMRRLHRLGAIAFALLLVLGATCLSQVKASAQSPADPSGSPWAVVPSPTINSQGESMGSSAGLSCASPQFCVAVSLDPYAPEIEDWNGDDWQIMTSPTPPEEYGWLGSVTCPSSTFCMAIGGYVDDSNSEEPLMEEWNGNDWAIVPNAPSLGSVSCTSATFCMAAGGSGFEEWDGSVWTALVGSYNGTGGPGTISCVSASFCAAVGDDYATIAGAPSYTLYYVWDGSSWSGSETPSLGTEQALYALSCTSPTFCMTDGFYYPSSEQDALPLAEEWNGSGWSLASPPDTSSADQDYIFGVSCADQSFCMATGWGLSATQSPLTYTWDGDSWTQVTAAVPSSTGTPWPTLTGVSCPTAGVCFSYGSYWTGSIEAQLVEEWNQPPPSSNPDCSVTLIPGTDQPALVVILGSGVGSSLPSDAFYPVGTGTMPTNYPTVTSYCADSGGNYTGVINGSYPQSVIDAAKQYEGVFNAQYTDMYDPLVKSPSPPQGIAAPPLTDQLAEAGAVILPYSYTVAHLNCSAGPPLMKVNSYSRTVPENEAMNTQASALYTEIAGIHACWPQSAIDIVAESGSGVPAEYYWNTAYFAVPDHDGVRHVFTLDSPINGINIAGPATLAGPFKPLVLGKANRDFYGELWANLDSNDANELAIDNGSFVPTGTYGDATYVLGDQELAGPVAIGVDNSLQGLLSQMLFSCSYGVVGDTCNGVLPPDYLSACSGAAYGMSTYTNGQTPSHDVMKVCDPTVANLVSVASGDEQNAISGTDPPASSSQGNTTEAGPDPQWVVPTSGPALSDAYVTGQVGQGLTMDGSDLGSAAGTVTFTGASGPGAVAGSVTSWSNGSVSVIVPTGAVSGPVLVTVAGGATELSTGFAVLGTPSAATSLQTVTVLPSVGGQPEQLQVTALTQSGTLAPGVAVSVFDGLDDYQQVTNASGEATFSIVGYGVTENLLAYAGTAVSPVQMSWAPVPGPLYQPLSLLPDDGPAPSSPISAAGVTLTTTQSVSATVAQFTDPNPAPASFATSIDWGDGSPSTIGTVTADPNGGWDVSGSHNYADSGTYSVVVSISDDAGVSASATSTVTVTQPGIVIGVTGSQVYGGTLTFQPDFSARSPGHGRDRQRNPDLFDQRPGLQPSGGQPLHHLRVFKALAPPTRPSATAMER